MAKRGVNDWSNLQFFLAVARAGSYQAAARVLSTNQTTVARRMHRLEAELETKLFDRHAHGMQLSEPGERVLKKLGAISEAIAEVEKSVIGLQTKESGRVTIAVNDGIGAMWLLPTLPDFYKRYPAIDLKIRTNEKFINLLSHDADVLLQLEQPKETRMAGFKAGKLAHRMFVSAAYVARKGMPQDMASLREHDVIDHEPYHLAAYDEWWVQRVLATARTTLTCNSANILLAATRQGTGIGLFPAFYARTAPDLIAVPIPVPIVCGVWVVTHEETNKSRRVRAVVEYLRERFRSDRETWFPSSG